MSKGYWEGWGFNDTFKVVLTGKVKDVSSGLKEMKQAFPKSDVKKIDSKSFYVFVYDNELNLVKKIAKMFNLKTSYPLGGKLDNEKLIYVLYKPSEQAINILNQNGKTYVSWWLSDLSRAESELLISELKEKRLMLDALIYTGDRNGLKFAEGGNIGEMLASSNPYIGGAKVVQGIAPESVSAIDKKLANKINPDPNRPIFFKGGGKTPKGKNFENYKKAVDTYIKERYNEDVDWALSMILFDDRTEETTIKKAVIVTKNGNEYNVTHQDLFSKYRTGGLTKKQQSNKIRKVMREFKEGTLYSSSGQKVTDRKQAIAIALSEAGASKYEHGGMSDLEYQVEDVKNWDNDELANVLEISEEEVKKDRQGAIRQVQNWLMIQPSAYSKGGKTPKLQVGDKVVYPKDPKKRVGFISKITGSGMAFVDFVREGKVELFDLEELKKTTRIPYSKGGKLELHDAVLYNGETWFYTEKNGVKGITKTSQGAWGSNYPFIALSKLDVDNDLTDMYGRKVKFDNGGTAGSTDYSVAQIILNQLGGMKRLVIMTGAYNFVASNNSVSFRIKNRKVNYIKITLNGKDLYDVKFSRIFNYQEKIVKEYTDLYFDQLIPIFEETTGMYLRMFKKGGFVNTQNRDMVISQLKTIHHHEQEMLNTLKNSGEVEAWVLSKVSNASSDLSDIAHYLEFKN